MGWSMLVVYCGWTMVLIIGFSIVWQQFRKVDVIPMESRQDFAAELASALDANEQILKENERLASLLRRIQIIAGSDSSDFRMFEVTVPEVGAIDPNVDYGGP